MEFHLYLLFLLLLGLPLNSLIANGLVMFKGRIGCLFILHLLLTWALWLYKFLLYSVQNCILHNSLYFFILFFCFLLFLLQHFILALIFNSNLQGARPTIQRLVQFLIPIWSYLPLLLLSLLHDLLINVTALFRLKGIRTLIDAWTQSLIHILVFLPVLLLRLDGFTRRLQVFHEVAIGRQGLFLGLLRFGEGVLERGISIHEEYL